MQPGNEQQDDSNVNNSSGNPREGRQQQPPSTLNLGTNNNNHLESVQSNSSANNSPFIKVRVFDFLSFSSALNCSFF